MQNIIFRLALNVVSDVANHIIASEKYRAPKDYSDSFMVLQEEGLISDELGEKITARWLNLEIDLSIFTGK